MFTLQDMRPGDIIEFLADKNRLRFSHVFLGIKSTKKH